MHRIRTKARKAHHAMQRWAYRKARVLFCRRMLVLMLIALALEIVAECFKIHLFGKAGELFTASVVEHVFIKVPIMEE